MRKVIQHESKTYLALMPVVEKPTTPISRYDISTGQDLHSQFSIDLEAYNRWKCKWILCTGFEIGQEVEEGEWEMLRITNEPEGRESIVAIPKQQPEREGRKMNLDTQAIYLNIIQDDFENMKEMLEMIQERIAGYPVFTQLEFIKPLKLMISEAWIDAGNPNDSFLNNYDGAEKMEI